MWSFLRPILVVLVAVVSSAAVPARAGTIWQWTHQAEGEGTANVFDGGPVEFDSGSTTEPGDTGMGFLGFDLTRPGVMGARYGTSGRSQLFPHQDDLFIRLDFSTDYSATSYLGSDRPGGEGSGWIRSVVEVVMPTDEAEWIIELIIEETPGFTGSTRTILENLTDGITLFETGESTDSSFLLSDVRGDVMRLTLESEGHGSAPEGVPARGFYSVIGGSLIIIPEPATLAVLATGIAVVISRRSRRTQAC